MTETQRILHNQVTIMKVLETLMSADRFTRGNEVIQKLQWQITTTEEHLRREAAL